MATRSAKLYQGEDSSPVIDYTDQVIWEESEFGTRAWQGEGSASTVVIRDPLGEQGNALNLPSGLTFRSLASKNLFVIDLDGDIMFRGRVGLKNYSRDDQLTERYRQVECSLHDTHWDLDHIFVHDYARPQETGNARIQGVMASYLSGSPRPTTDLNGSNFLSSSNTITLAAQTFNRTSPLQIIKDTALAENKQFFITGDTLGGGSMFYDGNDSTIYPAGLRISDRPDEVFAPPVEGGSGYVNGEVGTPHPTIPTPNGDAELGPDGSGYAISGWGEFGVGLSIVNNTNPGPPPFGYGNYYIGVNGLSPGQYYTAWRTAGTTFAASTEFVVQFWFNAPDQSLRVRFGDIVAGDYTTTLLGTTQANEWKFGTFSWTPSANRTAVEIRFDLGASGTANGKLYMDQVTLIDTGSQYTVPPIWNVGPASTEDGSEQLCEVILFYGTGADQYVTAHNWTVHTQYGHASQTFTDDTIVDATEAQRRANSILAHRQYEDKTYNVTIGPLTDGQVLLVKHGQTINIKARAIPDADDQFRLMRIVQCRYTTPVVGVWFAHLQLGRPWKIAPYGNGVTPAPASSAVATAVSIADSGGYFSGTDVEAALQELGANSGVTDHGALTGLTDDDHTQYLKETDVAAKGDLYAASANDTVGVLSVGSNGQVLTVDSTQALGVKWATPGSTAQRSILLESGSSVPFTFDEILQESDGSDFLWASE